MSQVGLAVAVIAAMIAQSDVSMHGPGDRPQLGPAIAQPLGGPFQVQFTQSLTGRRVQILLDGRSLRYSQAGKLFFRDARGSGASVCADVRAPIARGMVFTVRPFRSAEYGGNVSKAGNIVAKHFREAQSADQCAGLQLAVWEAIEDGGANAGFRHGRFQAHAHPSVLAWAEKFYASIGEKGDALYLEIPPGGNGGTKSGQPQLTTTTT